MQFTHNTCPRLDKFWKVFKRNYYAKVFLFNFLIFLSFVLNFLKIATHHELNVFKLLQFIIKFISFYYMIYIFLEVIISKVAAYKVKIGS